MTTSGTTATVLATVLLIGTVAPVAAVGTSPGGSHVQAATTAAEPDSAATGGVDVSVGQQLSTITIETDSDVRSEVEETTFEVRFEGVGEDGRAAAIARRAAELAERAIAIHEDYEAATRAHEAGEISDSQYAERIATLNARADDVVESLRRLRRHASEVSPIALRAEGLTRADLRTVDGQLDAVTGTGASALLRRFTGRSEGEVRIETRDGLSIEVEGEDGELSREFERPRDDSTNLSVVQGDALETARTALGAPPEGNWTLERAAVHDYSGYYEFEFALTGVDATGEGEVRVDGSSGDVFRLETEIEAPDDGDEPDEEGEPDEDDHGGDGRDDELVLLVAEGTPGPNETVTLLALADGDPIADATVSLNGSVVGSTDGNGTLAVTLPSDEARLRAETDDADGELEFEFDEGERDDAEIRRHLDATADVESGTVTVGVSYNGTPVEGATVAVDDREVGTTDANGSVSFTTERSDDLEVEVRKGAFVADLEFEMRDGSLTLVEVEIDDADEADRTDDGDGTEADDDERSGDDGNGTERDEDAEADGDETETRRETDTEETTEHDVELAVRIVEGPSEPGATVTVAVTDGGSPVADAVVLVNDDRVGTTDDEGYTTVTLPDADRVEIVAEHDGEDAELELRFDDDSSGSGSDGSTEDDDTDDR